MKFFIGVLLLISLSINFWMLSQYEKVPVNLLNPKVSTADCKDNVRGKQRDKGKYKDKINESSQNNEEFSKAEQDSPDYETLKEKSLETIKRYAIEKIYLEEVEVKEIFSILSKAENKFEKKMEENRKNLVASGIRTNFYSYEPEDYIELGKHKLSAREEIKSLIGKEKFEQLRRFIIEYNYGVYEGGSEEGFVPLDF